MISKNDKNIIESLIRGGASSEEILAEMEKVKTQMKAEEEAKQAKDKAAREKEVKRNAARTKLIEAVMNYAMAFGWMEKADIQDEDIKALDEALRAEESVIDRMKEFGDKFWTDETMDGYEDVLERLIDGLMGDFAKDTKKDSCKCGTTSKKCDASDCSQSKSSKSLLDEISELLKQ